MKNFLETLGIIASAVILFFVGFGLVLFAFAGIPLLLGGILMLVYDGIIQQPGWPAIPWLAWAGIVFVVRLLIPDVRVRTSK